MYWYIGLICDNSLSFSYIRRDMFIYFYLSAAHSKPNFARCYYLHATFYWLIFWYLNYIIGHLTQTFIKMIFLRYQIFCRSFLNANMKHCVFKWLQPCVFNNNCSPGCGTSSGTSSVSIVVTPISAFISSFSHKIAHTALYGTQSIKSPGCPQHIW